MQKHQNTQAPSINEQSFKNLVTARNKRPVTSSRKIAKLFQKRHNDVLRDIRNLGCSKEFWLRNFAQRDLKDVRGKIYPEFEITFDGFVILAMGYTGEKAMQFKEAYINCFNEMAQKLQEREDRAVLTIKDFIRLHDKGNGFIRVLQDVPFLTDEYSRKWYHYLFALEKLGFSTRSGAVWKRQRNNPAFFMRKDNSDYVAADFIYNMYLGKVKASNDKVFKSSQLALPFPNQEGGGHD